MVKLRWLKSARDDLKDIYDFIAADSKKYASFQVQKIRNRTDILKKHPKSGKEVKEFQDEKIREIVSGHYRIFYRIISEDLIHILLVHHGARKLPRKKKN
jgi:addiction module RelE/StbE family toxin